MRYSDGGRGMRYSDDGRGMRYSDGGALPDPMKFTPSDSPRNFDFVQKDPFTYILLEGHSA